MHVTYFYESIDKEKIYRNLCKKEINEEREMLRKLLFSFWREQVERIGNENQWKIYSLIKIWMYIEKTDRNNHENSINLFFEAERIRKISVTILPSRKLCDFAVKMSSFLI